MTGFSSRASLPVSGIIIAQNEERYIEKAILNMRPNVKEVIVLDGGSTDKTIEIATKLGCRVEHRPFDFHFAAQRNFAMNLVTTPWALWLDADEYFMESAYDVIPSLIMSKSEEVKNVAAYQFFRESIFDGKRVDDGKDWQWRLTKIGACRWEGKVHEGLVFADGMVGKKLQTDYVLRHEHTMKRQIWSNKLYENINTGVAKRPGPKEGCEFHDTKGGWVPTETDRDA